MFVLSVDAQLLNLVHEHFGGLESGDFVFRDDDGSVFGDITSCLFRTCFDDEAARTAQVYVVALCE